MAFLPTRCLSNAQGDHNGYESLAETPALNPRPYAAATVCQNLTEAKTTPTVGLTTSPAVPPMTAGGTATGTASLTGATAAAGGTVTYTVYKESTRVTPLTGTNNPNTVTVVNHFPPDSAAITIDQAGTVYWQAAYTGDANNTSATSACDALAVAKLNPSLSLTVSSSPMQAGGTATGSASLSGATATAGGTVTYSVSSDNTCTTPVRPARTTNRWRPTAKSW